MGRVRTLMIKKMALKLLEQYGDKFTTNFEYNKKVLKEILTIPSKKIRNILAGYIAELKSKSQKAS